MEIKEAEDLLMELAKNEEIIDDKIVNWSFEEFCDSLETSKILSSLQDLVKVFFETPTEQQIEALYSIIFHKIHDVCFATIKSKYSIEDKYFFEKCLLLRNVSAEQLGSNENYGIPLSAAIVELSVLDKYKTPSEKLNCLWTTFDLLFAEIKTAMVSVISENSEKENEIPVIDNVDVLPVLMAVVIKSKLVHFFSNLFYIKAFYYNLDKNRSLCEILKTFEKATNRIVEINPTDLDSTENKLMKSIDLEEYVRLTTAENKTRNKTLVDEANRRSLNLIIKSTDDEQ